jgi:hypothetical protein
MLLDLRRLEAEPLGDYEACASPYPVRRDAGQVPETLYLVLLRALAIYADRRVPRDDVYLLVCRGVLEVLADPVERYFLLEPLDLAVRWDVLADAKLAFPQPT